MTIEEFVAMASKIRRFVFDLPQAMQDAFDIKRASARARIRCAALIRRTGLADSRHPRIYDAARSARRRPTGIRREPMPYLAIGPIVAVAIVLITLAFATANIRIG